MVAERLEDVPVAAITPNDENPRQVSKKTDDDRLAESIDAKGVLVPVYVYEDGEGFRLIDGERRWRQATRLGLETIPALVREDKPDDAENIIEMFNIHLVRAQWDDMPTALALAKVMERTGTTNLDELRHLTGLSKERIKDYQLILDLPKRYQEMISEGAPMNLFVELEENVIRPLGRERPRLAAEFPADAVREAFLKKRDGGSLSDIVDLRKMRPIIKQAAEDAGEPDRDSELDQIVRELITEPEASIDEAYAEIALASVEITRLSRAARSLLSSIDRLIDVTAEHPEDREELRRILEETIGSLNERAAAL